MEKCQATVWNYLILEKLGSEKNIARSGKIGIGYA